VDASGIWRFSDAKLQSEMGGETLDAGFVRRFEFYSKLPLYGASTHGIVNAKGEGVR
jgi:hypothetical protein